MSDPTSGKTENSLATRTSYDQDSAREQVALDGSSGNENVLSQGFRNDLCDHCSSLDLPSVVRRAEELGDDGPYGPIPDEFGHGGRGRPGPTAMGVHGPFKPLYAPGPRNVLHGIFVAKVGKRYRRMDKPSCSLCQMLAASRVVLSRIVTSRIGVVEWTDPGYDEIRAVSFLWYFLDVDDAMRAKYDSLCLFVVPVGLPLHWDKAQTVVRDHIQNTGCAVLYRDDNHPVAVLPRSVPLYFDPSTVLGWVDHCSRHHHSLCEKEAGSMVHGLQVINCRTLTVEEAQVNVPYTTLSYVWGASHKESRVRRVKGGKAVLPAILPQVVADSIKVTLALGYNHLWVDKYCIDQDNAETKHEQIQQMDAVYESSVLTIIAAAGVDETYGLPGVSRHRRTWPLIRHQGVSVSWTTPNPQVPIRASHWATRGWTFQEAVLSRRRLVFTDDQMYFECNTMHCFEIVNILSVLGTSLNFKMDYFRRIGMFGKSKYIAKDIDRRGLAEQFYQYLSYANEYSGRQLKYDKDAMNAFQGIVRRYSKSLYSIRSNWGLPYPTRTDSRQNTANHEEMIRWFAWALCWHHERTCWDEAKKPRRRSGFPSWSWVGWEGQAWNAFSVTVRSVGLWFENSMKGLLFQDNAGRFCTLPELQSLERSDKFKALMLTGVALSPLHFSYEPAENMQRPWSMGLWAPVLTTRRISTRLFLSHGAVSEAQFAAELLQDGDTWKCVLIGSLILKHETYVMVLKAQPGTDSWSRAGLFVLDWHVTPQEVIHHQSSPQRTWETFIVV